MVDRGQAGYWQSRPFDRVSRRRLLRGGATFVTGGIGLGLVGCSGSGTRKQNSAATRAATAAGAVPTAALGSVTPTPASASGAGTPVQAGNFKTGGTIQGAIAGVPNLDPVAAPPIYLAGFHYSRLFRFNSGPDPQTSLSHEPVPDLVSGYEITPDGLTYTMQLRQGVTFHPPLSRPLSSADVHASWDYFTTSPKNLYKDAYAPLIDRFTTPDDKTLVFTLKYPAAAFLNKLANAYYLWILSAEAATGRLDPQQVVTGTGPWIFVGLTPTAYMWTKNPDYFVKGIPYADGAQLNIIGDTATQGAQFAAGKLDTLDIPAGDVDAITQAAPKASIHEYVPNALSFCFFSNVQDPNSPFHDVRLRQAASLAIDRQALIDTIYSGRGVWDNLINPGLGKWCLDPRSPAQGASTKWFKQDLKTARQLIAAAGHTNTAFTFLYTNNAYGTVFNETADAIGRMLAAAGFKITVVTVDYAREYINSDQGIFFKGAPPNTVVYALETPFTEPDDFLTGMLTRDGNRNHDRLDDQDLAALVQKQQVELDENKRLQLVYEIQRAHAEKMYYPPIVYPKSYIATQPWVQNFFVANDLNPGTESYAYISVNNR